MSLAGVLEGRECDVAYLAFRRGRVTSPTGGICCGAEERTQPGRAMDGGVAAAVAAVAAAAGPAGGKRRLLVFSSWLISSAPGP